MRVLVDTNVFLDVLLKREPFCKDSIVILYLAKETVISAILTAVSMTTIFYILQKYKTSTVEIHQELEKLTALFSVASVSGTTIENALSLRWNDFEDAVQFIAAKENKADYIIT